MARLDGKVAVVTGGSRGIGRRTVEAFAREGADVAILSRDLAKMQEVTSALPTRGLPLECNVGDPDSVRRAFAAIRETFGGVDILVNNAAQMRPQLLAEADDELLLKEIQTNLLGPIYTAREAVPLMKARGAGDIINISSEIVRAPFAFLGPYAAAKAGMEIMSAALRLEVRADNIRVMVLRSGYVKESSLRAGWPPDVEQRYMEWMANSGTMRSLGEPIEPSTTAGVIVDLACLPREASIDFLDVRPV